MKTLTKMTLSLADVTLLNIIAMILVFSLSLALSTQVSAGERVAYEGTFQGASCVHFKKECPEDEAHIAIEHDFVLLLPNGEHYFLPNLNRAIKARYVAKPVRISGESKGHEIWVDLLDVKKDNKYINVWSWKKQQEMYKGGGG
jgi:hypothetical protein